MDAGEDPLPDGSLLRLAGHGGRDIVCVVCICPFFVLSSHPFLQLITPIILSGVQRCVVPELCKHQQFMYNCRAVMQCSASCKVGLTPLRMFSKVNLQ